MRNATLPVIALLLSCLGCGGSQSAPATPTEAQPVPATRSELTAEACTASGGTVVGDIGDGAIHKAEYRCPGGAAPTGNIRAPEGGPIAVEGSVCCPR